MKSKFYLFLAIILLFGVFVSAQNNLLNTTVYMPSDEYFSESKSGTYLTWNKIHYIYLKLVVYRYKLMKYEQKL